MDKSVHAFDSAVSIVILAAGQGRRFGCPKALAQLEGESWLKRSVKMFSAAGLFQVTVVVGAEVKRVIAESGLDVADESRSAPKAVIECDGCARSEFAAESDSPPTGISWLYNQDWPAGRTGSIVLALSKMSPATEAIIIHQVDFPFVLPSTVVTLVKGFHEINATTGKASSRIILPGTDGRSGHPILIGSEIWPEITALGMNGPLSAVIHRDRDRVIYLDVNDPGIHRNLNKQTDLP